MIKKRLSKPTSQEEKMIIDVHAIGEGIAPIYSYHNWVKEPDKIPRSAKRKFRKLWRSAEKWLEVSKEQPNWYRTFGKSQLVASYLMEKIQKNI